MLKDVATLVELADNHVGGMEIWIAEPVLWEWAQHLQETHEIAFGRVQELRKAGYDVPEMVALDVKGAVDHVRSKLEAMGDVVKVLSIRGVAEDALRDQVLVQSPGERITTNPVAARAKRKKTGAADSAIYRAYHEKADGNGAHYVLASSDSDVTKAFKAWGVCAPRVYGGGLDLLRKDIFRLERGSSEIIWACVALLREKINELDATALSSSASIAELDSLGAPVVFDVTGGVQIVGLSDVRVDAKSRFASAHAFLLGDVAIRRGIFLDPFDEAVDLAGEEYAGCHIGVDLVFTLDDGNPVDVRVEAANNLYRDSGPGVLRQDDGPYALLEGLTLVPGLEEFEWSGYLEGELETETFVDSDPLRLVFSGDPAFDWTLEGTYRGQSVHIFAEALNDGFERHGWGEPSHSLLTTDSAQTAVNAEMSLNLLLMNTPSVCPGPRS